MKLGQLQQMVVKHVPTISVTYEVITTYSIPCVVPESHTTHVNVIEVGSKGHSSCRYCQSQFYQQPIPITKLEKWSLP